MMIQMMKLKVMKKKNLDNDNDKKQEKAKLFNKLHAIAIIQESVVISANLIQKDDKFQPSIYIRGKTKTLHSFVSPNTTIDELKIIINEEETGNIQNDYKNKVPAMTLHSKGVELNGSKKIKRL